MALPRGQHHVPQPETVEGSPVDSEKRHILWIVYRRKPEKILEMICLVTWWKIQENTSPLRHARKGPQAEWQGSHRCKMSRRVKTRERPNVCIKGDKAQYLGVSPLKGQKRYCL